MDSLRTPDSDGFYTAEELAESNGITTDRARKWLKALKTRGMVEQGTRFMTRLNGVRAPYPAYRIKAV